ncbi:PIG-M-domain-containing protein [Jimgerdemannia flammicorona]|uniref:GPI mannosyltransferase 1 n=1 Tax=Jimgerdemannia flammicorona TaxID=994334 RepID=A0A433Q5P9_9FUNG|nr:PIG-M-domain-containing protein [Jimgerdemannia flammicorona]
MPLPSPSFQTLTLLGLLFRLALLVYGEYQDAHFVVKYTDIDYIVFTDAARFAYGGRSPYDRDTYRYTPLLALLLAPNVWLHRAFGKCVFVASDLVVGYLLQRILQLRGMDARRAARHTALWLLNPVVANISTRGSVESVMGALVLASLYCLLTRRFYAACALYGLSVHFKIYPVVYALPLLSLLDESYRPPREVWRAGCMVLAVLGIGSWGDREDGEGREGEDDDQGDVDVGRASGNNRESGVLVTVMSYAHAAIRFVTPTRVMFGLLSGGVFFALTGIMYQGYGEEFLEHTYLYHVTRKDHRHNFSVWFYYMYLTLDSPSGRLLGVLTFVPQLALVAVVGAAFGRDIFFACFLQTFVFVMYNKVCTAQALWLSSAYRLEFLGENTFRTIWLASLAMFAVNCWIVVELVRSHMFEYMFARSGKVRWVWGNGEVSTVAVASAS